MFQYLSTSQLPASAYVKAGSVYVSCLGNWNSFHTLTGQSDHGDLAAGGQSSNLTFSHLKINLFLNHSKHPGLIAHVLNKFSIYIILRYY